MTSAPSTLGRYEIEAEIGRGMMGVVYRARDPDLHRVVALKTVSLAWAISDTDRELFERRFLNEARVAGGLQHPGIVVVHDVGRDATSGTLFIALEFLEGNTLAQITAAGTRLEWREAVRITAQVASALQHAHEKGVVHRDVKPANIMLQPTGEAKIMDFGIAKFPAGQLTAAGEFFGTPSYMSPEQAGAGSVDARSDLFSLGSVLYLLLTGRRAFDAPSVATILTRVQHQDPPPPSSLEPGLPLELDYVLRRALAKEKDARYPDARAFAEDLEDILEGRPPRHRDGWLEPPFVDGTLLSDLVEVEPETADLKTPRILAPTLPARARPRVALLRPALLAGLGVFAVMGMVLALSRGPAPAASPLPRGTREAATPPASEPTSGGSFWPPFFQAPGKLELTLQHGLRSGSLKVLVDDAVAFERELEAPVTRKIVFYKVRRERFKQVLDVAPGEHNIRIEIAGEDDSWSKRIRGDFKSGETRTLEASLGGIIGKDLDLTWGPSLRP